MVVFDLFVELKTLIYDLTPDRIEEVFPIFKELFPIVGGDHEQRLKEGEWEYRPIAGWDSDRFYFDPFTHPVRGRFLPLWAEGDRVASLQILREWISWEVLHAIPLPSKVEFDRWAVFDLYEFQSVAPKAGSICWEGKRIGILQEDGSLKPLKPPQFHPILKQVSKSEKEVAAIARAKFKVGDEVSLLRPKKKKPDKVDRLFAGCRIQEIVRISAIGDTVIYFFWDGKTTHQVPEADLSSISCFSQSEIADCRFKRKHITPHEPC